MKKFLHILKILIVVIASIIAAAFIAIQAPAVQTFIAEKAVAKLKDATNADITFSHIHFKPFTQLIIDDLAVIDTAPIAPEPGDIPIDTLFRAGNISVKFSLSSLLGGEGLHFSQARIRNAQMNLVLEGEQVNLGRMFGLEAKEDTTAVPDKEIFSIGDVRIENMGYSMYNYGPERLVPEGTYRKNGEQVGIDWTDLEVKDINLKGKNLKMRGKVIGGNLLEMTFRERSGFNCRHISGDARAGNGNVIIRNLKIRDDYSDLALPFFAMRYAGATAFADFLNQVHLEGRIENSFLDFKTLTFFAPTLENTGLRAYVSGQVSGPVSNMQLKNVRVNMDDGSFAGTMNGRISNIADIYDMRIDARLSACMFSSRGVDRLVNAWTEERIDFRKFAKGQRFMMDCIVEGKLNHLRVMPYISSLHGNMDADLQFRHLIDPKRPIQLKGLVRSRDLDAGKIAGTDALGPITMETSASLIIPVDGKSSMSVHIDSLKIRKLNLLGYDYQGIAAAGDLTSDYFDGKVICNDPNLNFLFQGLFTLVNDKSKSVNRIWKFYANIGHADLHALKLDKRPVSRLRLRTAANFTTSENRDVNGKISIDGVTLENSSGVHNIGNVDITADLKDNISRMKFKSAFLDGSFAGSASPLVFLDDLMSVTVDRDLPVLGNGSKKVFSGNRYEVNFDFSDSRDLLSFLIPGLYIADKSSVRLRLDAKGLATARVKSPRIAYKDKFIKDMDASFSNSEGSLSGNIFGNLVNIGPKMSIDEARLSLYADDDKFGLGFNYGESVEDGNDGEILTLGTLGRDKASDLSLQLRILPSGMRINSADWDIHEAELSIADGHIRIDGFGFSNGDQGISINGCIDRNGGDSLRVDMERFGIDLLNPLLPDNMQLSGSATGSALLVSPIASPDLNLDIVCDSAAIGGVNLGLLTARCHFDKTFKRFDAQINNLYEGQLRLDGHAFYTPSSQMLEADARFNGFNLGIAKPFVGEIFNEIGGELSGNLRYDSTPGRYRIASENLRLDNGLLSLLFTNVPYTVNGPLEIDTEGAHFKGISLKDRENGTGTLDGSILFGGFTRPELDLRATVQNMECLNVTQKESPYFYGHIYGSGSASIRGPFSALVLDIDASTEKTGDLHIPIPNTSTAGNNNLLRFKGIEVPVIVDPYEEMMKKIKDIEAATSDFAINLRVNATPGVMAYIEIDKASGNILSARGSGMIELNSSSQRFDINGDYNISGGNYKFVALGIASRDFEIKEGSSIKFNGDIMDSNLNIDAVYKTKASLSTLIADTTSVNTRRNVECGIQITDKLRNPRIGFSINVPDIDPTVKSKVESALSTQDKIQKQFLSLIISNAFLPDEQSGIFNTSTILASNLSEVMSGQLNNILQRLNIPLDLGLNYQPNDRGNDVFDVAVSTQLFNNRVIVNGNIGNRQYTTSGSNTDIVGDIEIEIKLDRKGSWRLNLFSHSADQYTNYLDNSQRNGLGMAYQVEFNGISDEDRKDLQTISIEEALK